MSPVGRPVRRQSRGAPDPLDFVDVVRVFLRHERWRTRGPELLSVRNDEGQNLPEVRRESWRVRRWRGPPLADRHAPEVWGRRRRQTVGISPRDDLGGRVLAPLSAARDRLTVLDGGVGRDPGQSARSARDRTPRPVGHTTHAWATSCGTKRTKPPEPSVYSSASAHDSTHDDTSARAAAERDRSPVKLWLHCGRSAGRMQVEMCERAKMPVSDGDKRLPGRKLSKGRGSSTGRGRNVGRRRMSNP